MRWWTFDLMLSVLPSPLWPGDSPGHPRKFAVEIVDLIRLERGASEHLGARRAQWERRSRACPDQSPLGQGRRNPMAKEQMALDDSSSRTKRLGVADVQERSEERQ